MWKCSVVVQFWQMWCVYSSYPASESWLATDSQVKRLWYLLFTIVSVDYGGGWHLCASGIESVLLDNRLALSPSLFRKHVVCEVVIIRWCIDTKWMSFQTLRIVHLLMRTTWHAPDDVHEDGTAHFRSDLIWLKTMWLHLTRASTTHNIPSTYKSRNAHTKA